MRKPLHEQEDEMALKVAVVTLMAIAVFIGIIHSIYLLTHRL